MIKNNNKRNNKILKNIIIINLNFLLEPFLKSK